VHSMVVVVPEALLIDCGAGESDVLSLIKRISSEMFLAISRRLSHREMYKRRVSPVFCMHS
jgi:hypothetical protein